jgi:hypothetical protein
MFEALSPSLTRCLYMILKSLILSGRQFDQSIIYFVYG